MSANRPLDSQGSAGRPKPRWTGSKLLWPVAALALLLLFNLVFTGGFFELEWRPSSTTSQHPIIQSIEKFFGLELPEGHLIGTPINILRNGSLVMLLSLGMTLVIATGGVDLSVGALIALAGAVVAVLVVGGHPLWVVLAAALGACILAGAWNGMLVSVFRVQPLVATLVMMVAGRGIAMLLCQASGINIPKTYVHYEAFNFIGNGFLFYVPVAITVVVAMLALTVLMTRETALGMFIEAVGDNDTASRYAGINARVVKLTVYAFSGLCAGIAGLIYTSNTPGPQVAKMGLYVELDAIMAVVIGGTALTGGRFFLLGSIVGALLIQTLTTTMITHGLSQNEVLVPKAVVVVAVCLLQSAAFREKVIRAIRTARPSRAGEGAK